MSNRSNYCYRYQNTCDGVHFKFKITRVKVFMFALRSGLTLCSSTALYIESKPLPELTAKIDKLERLIISYNDSIHQFYVSVCPKFSCSVILY